MGPPDAAGGAGELKRRTNAKAFHDKCGKQWKCWDACRLNTK
ncbi:hypothetical protein ABLN72_03200 [Mycobacterium tuberculosis]